MLSSNELYNRRVYFEDNEKNIGKVRAFVFYAKRCIGFKVKRPDVLWMFRRKQVFIPLDKTVLKKGGFAVRDKKALISDPETKVDNWNKTVIWNNMPVMFNGQKLGFVDNVCFDNSTGKISYIEVSKGSVSKAVLGNNKITEDKIKGYSFKKEAIILEDEADIESSKEGLASKAGKAASIATDKMNKESDTLRKMFKDFKDEFNEGMS